MIVNAKERYLFEGGGGIARVLKDTMGIRQSETSEAWRAYKRDSCIMYSL